MIKKLLLFVASLAFCLSLSAQDRYLDEVFAEVSVEEDVFFSANYGFFSGFMALDTLRNGCIPAYGRYRWITSTCNPNAPRKLFAKRDQYPSFWR